MVLIKGQQMRRQVRFIDIIQMESGPKSSSIRLFFYFVLTIISALIFLAS
jgi:hypothetical protein